MRVWCVGAGAVGGAVAARLARAGVEPLVIDADRDHIMRLRHPGLSVDGAVTPLVAFTPDDLGPDAADSPDVVLLSVRTQHTESALRPFVDRLRPDNDVVSLQNGLNEDRIAALVGPARTIGCVVGFGATWLGPGHVEVTAEGELILGRLDGSVDERLERVAALLDKAFPVRVTTNVLGALWGKMLVNSVTVLGAVGGMLTGEVLSDEAGREVARRAVVEGVDVATAEGVRLPKVLGIVDPALIASRGEGWAEALDAALDAMRERFGAVKSVTWRDLELGCEVEVDAVTGEIVRRGEARGVSVATSRAVYESLRRLAAGDDRSGGDLIRRVAAR